MGERGGRGPTSISKVLGDWLKESKLDLRLRPYVLAERWPELVGQRVATRTRPAGLRDGVLTVLVADNVWLTELNFLRDRLCTRINELLGQRVVKQIRLVVGDVRK